MIKEMTIAPMLIAMIVASGVACSVDKPADKSDSYRMGVALSVTYLANIEKAQDVFLRPAFVMDACDKERDGEDCRRGFWNGLSADSSLLHHPPLVSTRSLWSGWEKYARDRGTTSGQLTSAQKSEVFLQKLLQVAAERKDDLDGR